MEQKNIKLIGFYIGNFRVFKDEEYFDFAPINILTGKNNSGKSSLIKAMRLFANSLKTNHGLYLDFADSSLKLGNFDEVKNHYNSNSSEIDLGFRIEIEYENSEKIGFYFSSSYNQTGLSSFYVTINGEEYIQVAGQREGSGFKYTKSFIYLDRSILNINKLRTRLEHLDDESFDKLINETLQFLENSNELHISDNYSYNQILKKDDHPLFNVIEGIYYSLENAANNKSKPIFADILSKQTGEAVDEAFKKEYLFEYINKFLGAPPYVPSNLFSCFTQLDILESVRAEQSILFRYNDNARLTQLFKEYQNLPVIDYYDEETLTKGLDHEYSMQRLFIDQWLKRLGIMHRKARLQIEPVPGYGYSVSVKKNDKLLRLTELGYGFTQLIPMILQIWLSENKIILIEEPEANLHPALQSKLADLFCQAVKLFGKQFIIETHSEYLIRKLQYLTVKTDEELTPDDTVIYYFFPPDEDKGGEHQIRTIKIQPDGSLSNDFGTGFFDEADKIAMSIWNMNNSQKN
jgi:predicted ATPase